MQQIAQSIYGDIRLYKGDDSFRVQWPQTNDKKLWVKYYGINDPAALKTFEDMSDKTARKNRNGSIFGKTTK